ncbi:peptide-N4-(N-acetyl-beta-glucosaminyl)asparagine amidase A [Eucalyptus grandis]|nr:peptide-N4-(N-acetyl-beta-glucosaminyl)asparagine amidase A [Eucalyptus grandis]
MASSLSFLLLFLYLSSLSAANVHWSKLRRSSLVAGPELHTHSAGSPTRYFEVTRPIKLPKTKPCSYLALQHDFAHTYGKPPVLANYTLPSTCYSQRFSKIVLEWSATCKGKQYDRIVGVWLGGVELLRSCTAEPSATGIVWTVEKDITRYYSLLMKNGTLAVSLRNIVDSTYTGVYHVKIKFRFYPADDEHLVADVGNARNSVPGYGSNADLILPISRNLPLDDGLWFEIENATDTETKEFQVPLNVYRAVLEVYVSFHENDEFWYGNLPNEYIEANNLTEVDGNGPFREVVVSLDGEVVGAVWPFTVVYTGGIDPLLWIPITGIGSFDLPTYDIEITPSLAKILDGKLHEFGFNVTNALNVWYIDANLHLWLDDKSTKTAGKLLTSDCLPPTVSSALDFKGLDGKLLTGASRSISSSGWVKSSYGKITTTWKQEFNYSNVMVRGNQANLQIIEQLIQFNDSVVATKRSSTLASIQVYRDFPFYLYNNYVDQGNDTSSFTANITLAFNEKRHGDSGSKRSGSSLSNVQSGQSYVTVKNNVAVGGFVSTQLVYKYDGSELCYFRNVSSSNFRILDDDIVEGCKNGAESHHASPHDR